MWHFAPTLQLCTAQHIIYDDLHHVYGATTRVLDAKNKQWAHFKSAREGGGCKDKEEVGGKSCSAKDGWQLHALGNKLRVLKKQKHRKHLDTSLQA
jgi:hypothetical protein